MAKTIQWVEQRHSDINKYTNKDNIIIDLISQYCQIDQSTFKTACEDFVQQSRTPAKQRAVQNNKWMWY